MTVKLTVGGTINLGNYESLRVEVSNDNADGSPEDQARLVAILDDFLAGLGRTDPVTAGQIDAWRRRVLTREETPAPVPEPETPAAPPAEAKPERSVEREEKAEKPAEKPAAVFTCCECGAAVDKKQHDLSQLFTSKTLCKKCMEGEK